MWMHIWCKPPSSNHDPLSNPHVAGWGECSEVALHNVLNCVWCFLLCESHNTTDKWSVYCMLRHDYICFVNSIDTQQNNRGTSNVNHHPPSIIHNHCPTARDGGREVKWLSVMADYFTIRTDIYRRSTHGMPLVIIQLCASNVAALWLLTHCIQRVYVTCSHYFTISTSAIMYT